MKTTRSKSQFSLLASLWQSKIRSAQQRLDNVFFAVVSSEIGEGLGPGYELGTAGGLGR